MFFVWLAVVGAVGCGYVGYPAPPPGATLPPVPGQNTGVFTTAHATFGEAATHYFNSRPGEVTQPFEFPHVIHIKQNINCTDYCHTGALTGPVAVIPQINTCMICHDAIATDRPRIKQITAMRDKGQRPGVAAGLFLLPGSARQVQPRAAHPRQGRVRDLPRQHRRADGRPAQCRPDDGLLRELSQREQGASRLPDLSLLMDRRSFIKLTAITGTTAALASCGKPGKPAHPLRSGRRHRPGRRHVEAGRLPAVRGGLRPHRARDGRRRRRRARRPGGRRANLGGQEARRAPRAIRSITAGCARAVRRRFRSPITRIASRSRSSDRATAARAATKRSPGTRRSPS